MATPNFASPENASKYYVVLTSYEDEESGEVRYPEYWEYEDFKDNMVSLIEELPFNVYESGFIDNSRSYASTELTSLHNSKCFGDVEVGITVVAILTGAYYDGATLDYLVKFECSGYETDSIDDLLETFVDPYYSDMNEGMLKIQSKNAERFLEEELEAMSSKLEEVYERVSEHKLNCVGVFSNGEAVYESAE
jgi:hypothetical protein